MPVATEPRGPATPLRPRLRPGITSALYLVSDLFALALAALLAVGLKAALDPAFDSRPYAHLAPVLLFFPLAYALAGAYPGIGLAPPEELKRLTLATTLVYLALGAATFLFKEGATYSRAVFLLAWAMALFLEPLFRALARELFAKKPWWGVPVLILGAGETGQQIARRLARQPGLGLKPVGLLDDDPRLEEVPAIVPVLGGTDRAPELARALGVRIAVVALPEEPRSRRLALLDRLSESFPQLVYVPDPPGFSSLWVTPKDLGGVLGLEVRKRLLLPGPRALKRALDLALASVLGLALAPLFLILAAWIKLDSPGPVFFGHRRLGLGGRPFVAWKFRTMVQDAEAVLADYLARNPDARAEWAARQKLRNDPRVTRAGRILRKFSLDELPQLWNVLKGEMSLVGPRPIVEEEVPRYGEAVRLYFRVRPGMTGLWQVSGRNDTTYAERVELDAYYVRNWSVWLDLYLLARTAWVVLTRKGAY